MSRRVDFRDEKEKWGGEGREVCMPASPSSPRTLETLAAGLIRQSDSLYTLPAPWKYDQRKRNRPKNHRKSKNVNNGFF